MGLVRAHNGCFISGAFYMHKDLQQGGWKKRRKPGGGVSLDDGGSPVNKNERNVEIKTWPFPSPPVSPYHAIMYLVARALYLFHQPPTYTLTFHYAGFRLPTFNLMTLFSLRLTVTQPFLAFVIGP